MLRLLKNFYVEILLVFLFMTLVVFFSSDSFLQFDWDVSWLSSFVSYGKLQNLATIFLSIFLEGLPFILIGVLVSSLIHEFVNENTLWKLTPKNPFLSIPMATLFGLILPICECGIVPIARRLIEKKLPVYTAFTFLLAAPIVNPVTIISTYIAFGDDWGITLTRLSLGAGIAVVMGFLFFLFFRNKNVLRDHSHTCASDEKDDDCCSDHREHPAKHDAPKWKDKLNHALYHSIFEFMNMTKYFILGAFLASVFQTFVGFAAMKSMASHEWIAIIVMMGLAFGLSICSSSDAFIAASFRNAMGTAPLFAFLVYGPMMDLKNVLMMAGSFRASVIWFFWGGTTLLTIVSVICFL
jgi:uncharacterized membrane protein YraQ (UPF0718 family)